MFHCPFLVSCLMGSAISKYASKKNVMDTISTLYESGLSTREKVMFFQNYSLLELLLHMNCSLMDGVYKVLVLFICELSCAFIKIPACNN